ncbi:MAG: DNA polymerase IV [Clostridia bacterium]|nr:DNA polymerase IV [Clostridia bacterium]
MEKDRKDRVILHCDCNSFFASVETVLNPSYAGVPMAVCGSEEERHGIVLAKNELAKRYGIETAETVWSARQKCPDLVIAPPHHDAYVEFSHRINRIYDRYTDLVEPFSIDESWLDVTGSANLFGDGPTIAEKIRNDVKREIGVTISIGVSFNKMFAKIGSDYQKPDAVTIISRDNFKQIVYPLPVRAMMYVGPRTAAALENCNIRTIGALAAASPTFLVGRFGKAGEALHAYANGMDDSPVHSREERSAPKSVGNGMTFHHDLVSAEEIRAGLGFLSEEVAARLRAAGLRATTIALAVKDTLLQTISRQMPLPAPTNLGRELADAAMVLTRKAWNIGRPIRALTVTAMNLIPLDEGGEQIGFFDEEKDRRREKTTRIEDTMDKIRARYGKAAISSGATISSDFGISPHKKTAKTDKSTKTNEKNP